MMHELVSAERLIQVAMELEATGQVLYEVASTSCARDNKHVADLFARLAGEEQDHYNTFEQMLREQAEKTHRPPVSLTDAQRKVVQDLINDKVMPDPVATWQRVRHCTLANALEMAIDLERESIAFYAGILLGVTDPQDAEIVRRIIREEKDHEEDLLESFKNLAE